MFDNELKNAVLRATLGFIPFSIIFMNIVNGMTLKQFFTLAFAVIGALFVLLFALIFIDDFVSKIIDRKDMKKNESSI